VFDYVRTAQIEKEFVEHGVDTTYVTRSTGASITEGIGVEHLTKNIKRAKIDGAM